MSNLITKPDIKFSDYVIWELVFCENDKEFFLEDIKDKECALASKFLTNTIFVKFGLRFGLNIFPNVVINIEPIKYSISNVRVTSTTHWSNHMNHVKVIYRFTILTNENI